MKNRAKLFLKESLAPDGTVDVARVVAVCEYISQNYSEPAALAELRAYEKVLKPALAREEALVEISGEVAESTFAEIEKFLLKETGREKIRLVKKVNKDLLGGIRVTCADKIWEFNAKLAIEKTLCPKRQTI